MTTFTCKKRSFKSIAEVKNVNKKKLPPSQQKLIAFCESSVEGKHMLRRVARSISTKVAYSKGCRFLSDFLDKTLSEIVSEYKTDIQKNQYEGFDKWETIFNDFADYLREDLGYKSASVHLYHSGALALINENVPRSLRLRAKSPEVYSEEIPPITFDDLKKVYGMIGVRARAIICVFKDSGLSAADAVRLNFKDLHGFAENKSWVHIRTVREKEHVKYDTFLGCNAVEALKAYVTVRKQKGEDVNQDSPVFVKENKPFNRLNLHALRADFQRIQKQTGITISTHRLRKFFETYMALTVRHPIILKYWMGHKIKSGRDVDASYIIPPIPEQLKLYKESYKNIDLTPKPDEFEMVIAETQARTEGMTAEQKRKFIERLSTRNPKILEHPAIKKLIEESTKGGGLALEPKFKEIGESELLAYLTNGWRIVYKTEKGTVILQR